jgi:hypothetical protein
MLDQFTKNQLKYIIAESIDSISGSSCHFMKTNNQKHSSGMYFAYTYLLESLRRISSVIKFVKKNKELFK